MLHTGVISFCDRINANIKSSDAKTLILSEIESKYNVSILQRHWHFLDERAIQQIIVSPHLACLRSNGNPYFLYFTRYEDIPVIYYIDKKIHPGYQQPRIILARGMFNDTIFDGTLLDGEMVKAKDNSWIFLINDMIAYCGKHLFRSPLPQRLEFIYEMLKSHYVSDSDVDVCSFQVKRYIQASQEGVTALVELSRTLPYTCRGVYFWSFNLKYKPKLHNFDMSIIKPVIRKVKDTPDFREKPVAAIPEPPKTPDIVEHCGQQCGSDEKLYWLRKTEHPDVYEVYPTDNGKLQNNLIGIAHVSSMVTSKMLRATFKDATVTMYFQFKCKWNEHTQKWQPIMRA